MSLMRVAIVRGLLTMYKDALLTQGELLLLACDVIATPEHVNLVIAVLPEDMGAALVSMLRALDVEAPFHGVTSQGGYRFHQETLDAIVRWRADPRALN